MIIRFDFSLTTAWESREVKEQGVFFSSASRCGTNTILEATFSCSGGLTFVFMCWIAQLEHSPLAVPYQMLALVRILIDMND